MVSPPARAALSRFPGSSSETICESVHRRCPECPSCTISIGGRVSGGAISSVSSTSRIPRRVCSSSCRYRWDIWSTSGSCFLQKLKQGARTLSRYFRRSAPRSRNRPRRFPCAWHANCASVSLASALILSSDVRFLVKMFLQVADFGRRPQLSPPPTTSRITPPRTPMSRPGPYFFFSPFFPVHGCADSLAKLDQDSCSRPAPGISDRLKGRLYLIELIVTKRPDKPRPLSRRFRFCNDVQRGQWPCQFPAR